MSLTVYLYDPIPCPHCGKNVKSGYEVYRANITHNVNKIAMSAGIYEILWRPDEINVTTAKEIVDLLDAGISRLRANPEKFTPLNPKNGWGSYEGFVLWCENYLRACREYPEALIEVSR